MDNKLDFKNKLVSTVRQVSYMAHKHAYALSVMRFEGSSRLHNTKIIMRIYG